MTDGSPLEKHRPVRTPRVLDGEAVRLRFAGRRRALYALLDDESPAVWESVRAEIQRGGRGAERLLRRAAAGPRPRARARARSLLLASARRDVVRRLVRRAARADFELEGALHLLSRFEDPDYDARPYRGALDAMATEVKKRAARETTVIGKAMSLVQYLGGELGLRGSTEDYHHPDNVFLHRAIERRQGMPLTLTAIYLFVARRVGVRAASVPIPGHVMLRLYAGRKSLLVDPFHGGRLRTRRDCEKYLHQNGVTPQRAFFRDAPDPVLFYRQLRNLMNSLLLRDMQREARDLQPVASTLERAQRLLRPRRGGRAR